MTAALAMMMASPSLSAGISHPPLTAFTVTVPYGSSFATAVVSTAPGSGTPIVTSTNMSLEVLPTIRRNPRADWRVASETARLAALVASRPWTSTPMPISVIQRTRAIRVSCCCLGGRRLGAHPDRGPKRRIVFGRRRIRVVVELHREGCAALAHRAQVIHVTEHIHERHQRSDDFGIAAHVLPLDLPAPQLQIADDGAGEIFRRHHLDLHDRLEQDRLALLQRLAECRARCDFEG